MPASEAQKGPGGPQWLIARETRRPGLGREGWTDDRPAHRLGRPFKLSTGGSAAARNTPCMACIIPRAARP